MESKSVYPSPAGFGRGFDTVVNDRNRVLRNTYWMLALTMVPTTLGAYLGIAFNFALLPGSPFIGALLFLGIAFGFFFAIEKFKNSGVGVALLLGFTFFMGLMLSRILQVYLALPGGAQIVALAAGGTGLLFFGLATYATTSKRDFSNWGKFLFVGVIMLIVASLANIWLQLPALQLTIAVIALGLFSAYLLFDVSRIVNGGETNYVTATLAIYLDLYNIFVSLLQILGFARDE
ncbi:MAG TPA: Bax inhibitor-1/YccA family protein [Burkholderiaceae bacterium]|nr:Bax inhibitor-1/YccA family protein [Burkholderiaceae bacterium]